MRSRKVVSCTVQPYGWKTNYSPSLWTLKGTRMLSSNLVYKAINPCSNVCLFSVSESGQPHQLILFDVAFQFTGSSSGCAEPSGDNHLCLWTRVYPPSPVLYTIDTQPDRLDKNQTSLTSSGEPANPSSLLKEDYLYGKEEFSPSYKILHIHVLIFPFFFP